LANRIPSKEFVTPHARELGDKIIDEHIDFYVNNPSVAPSFFIERRLNAALVEKLRLNFSGHVVF